MKAEITKVIRDNTIPAIVGGRDVLCINESSIGHMVSDLQKLFKKLSEPEVDKNVEDRIDWVIGYMNAKWDSNFRVSTEANRRFIRGRLNDGHTPTEMQLVIDVLFEQWGTDATMSKYLRPITVFSASKFEGYLNQALRIQSHKDNMIYVVDAFGKKRRITKEQFNAAEDDFYKRLD